MKSSATLLCVLLISALTVRADPQSLRTSPEHLARQLIDQNRLVEALDLLNKRSLDGHNDAVYLRGYVLYRLNRLAEAKRHLIAIATLPSAPPEASYFLARIAETQGNRKEAIHWLQIAAEAKPPVNDTLARLGKLYWEVGELDNSQTWTERALEKTPWDGGLHYRLARIFQQKGQPAAAAREFQESSKRKSADSEAVQQLMRCSEALSSKDEGAARQIRGQFLQRSNLDPDLLLALGTVFAQAGAPDQSLELYSAAVSRDPSLFQAHFDLGLALLNLNRAPEAVTYLSDSCKLAPGSKQANAALGVAYVMQGKFAEAVTPLQAAREADNRDGKIAGLLSVAYFRTGAAVKAIPILRDLIRQNTADPKVYFLLIDCLNSDAHEEEALAVSTETVKKFPLLAKAWLSNGQQLARLGKYHEAGAEFARSLKLEPSNMDAMLGLAEAQQKDGDYQASLETYQRALAQSTSVTAALGAARSLVFLGKAGRCSPTARTISRIRRKHQPASPRTLANLRQARGEGTFRATGSTRTPTPG